MLRGESGVPDSLKTAQVPAELWRARIFLPRSTDVGVTFGR
ncbi:hypothetical protein FTUN_4377 [Frigoriglobus tundricola]|uniref:Uncharacterized protein n=1 Tax=Frigoriglobus tundricola TaxID=2774151 RepID=A0A6M5YRV6_9BACT|nr:hypothetical protein FTUN_4377 [Frigoriglobus tundricola]